MVNAFGSLFSTANFSVYIVGWKGVEWVIDESLLVFSLFVNLLGQVVSCRDGIKLNFSIAPGEIV